MDHYHAKFEYDKYYHVFNRGNNGETLYRNNDNYLYFLSQWKKYISPYAGTLAWCLMPNHFHFVIWINCDDSTAAKSLTKSSRLSTVEPTNMVNDLLEEQFRKLFMSYALAFNKQQKRKGSLFEKRFKRIEIGADEYLTRVIHYVHNNPIHHGFVDDYAEWRFSSYNSTISSAPTSLNRKAVLNWFGGTAAFKAFHKESKNFKDIKKLLTDDE